MFEDDEDPYDRIMRQMDQEATVVMIIIAMFALVGVGGMAFAWMAIELGGLGFVSWAVEQ